METAIAQRRWRNDSEKCFSGGSVESRAHSIAQAGPAHPARAAQNPSAGCPPGCAADHAVRSSNSAAYEKAHRFAGKHGLGIRIPDADYHAWSARLEGFGLRTSGEVDRFYFRSLYYREPNGILIELATDGPGFASDEDASTMGEKLSLPPFLEARRAEIEAKLKPLELPVNLPDSS